MDLQSALAEFDGIVSRLSPSDVTSFLQMVKESATDRLESMSKSNCDIMLESIRSDLRDSLPLDATSQTETIHYPTTGPNADCDARTTVHIDAFLYEEDLIDDICDEGKLSRNYCADCYSRNIKPLTFITHSASVSKIKYLFQYLLPDLRNKTVLDIGSRTGAILYGAYLFTEATRVVGVEIDASFCQLQQQVIEKYNMADRIQIIHGDILAQQELLQHCDVVTMNNVFEFFTDKEQQQRIWLFLYHVLRKPGTVIITSPSVETSLAELQTGIDVKSWLRLVETSQLQQTAKAALFDDVQDADIDEMFMYQVL